ncbi:hypothetical protein [Sphingomonas xinjiangensis]|uniref:DNA-binding transcriptional LysR family regulator n=1 Tax=Sphingomonas xinjiangensis TaxID=643568 RepID=A0A840YS65_9SPHN|nr:DNA-binding transcriptional LysR family regulator [Sphingomonas xinjiangensis]
MTFPPGGLYPDVMIDRIERERRRWYIAFTGNRLASVLSAVEAGLGVSVLPINTAEAYAVGVSSIFSAEAALNLSVYAWGSSGQVGELLEAIISVTAGR